MSTVEPTTAAFGSVLAPAMVRSVDDGTGFGAPDVVDVAAPLLVPAAHALHYGSACFEGLKAHRHPDGVVRPFRAADHVARLRRSAEGLHLPVPPAALVGEMIATATELAAELTPDAPGSLYLRPTLLGTDPVIGAATVPSRSAVLVVLASPVGEYFAGGPLVLAVETVERRTVERLGTVKAGANYVAALGVVERAREQHGADQVLFAPDGLVEETAASNVLVVVDDTLVTPELTPGFLHGITRDSLLRLARDLGLRVEERAVTVEELVELAGRPGAEVLLAGTAAVVASVGTLVVDDRRVGVAGAGGPWAGRLRDALVEVQTGRRPGPPEWWAPAA